MFTFVDHLKEEVDLEAQTIDGTRFYKVPSGKMYPSITSVTSFYNRDVFINWRKKVGEEKANKITRESTFRGTKYHDVVEYYIKNGTIDGCDMLPSTKFLFLSSKKNLDRIDNIHALEKSLYSDYLGLAGRVDCIAEFDGELAVIDFKTSTKVKPEKWIEKGIKIEKPVGYSISKSGILNLTRFLATKFAKDGIRVNTLTLGGVYNKNPTEFVKEYSKPVSYTHLTLPTKA